MTASYEYVLSEFPFTVRRTVSWGDCDPAGVVYTGRFSEYLLGAVMHFLKHVGLAPGSDIHRISGTVLPCKYMSLTFHVALWPNDVVDLRIHVGEIGEHTFQIVMHAVLSDGRLAFQGIFVPIFIKNDARVRRPVPDAARSALIPYLMIKDEPE
ncbi:thioesterase-like superfamily protein [Burkholderia cenocepacia]|uniref:Thioesterase-like superfamily protein n=1 Tax=Burkholderia cenocepacia TaxID=95486 RepID=A0AAN0VQP3_9BURK|nr:thioesterase-like superfamily protein [Burkholderia cenocepacia]